MRIPLTKPVFDEEMKEAATNALLNERYVLGESVYRFEEEFARHCGSKYAISTSSGTNALQLSLLALGIGRGDRAITTAWTFVATANVIIHVNATPEFVDADLRTCTINPREIPSKVSRKTKAIIPVHLYGYPAEMGEILQIAEQYGLKVVEDACQAHGATYDGRKAGSLGDAGCFSFYPSKNMTVAGDGGIVVTDNEEIAHTVAKLRDCGRTTKYKHDVVGYTARLNTVNAAIGLVQLRHLDKWNEKRREHAQTYREHLKDVEGVILPPEGGRRMRRVYHLYVIRVREPSDRDPLRDWLDRNEIECGVHYPIPVHLQPIYRKLCRYERGDFPVSEGLAETVLSLPMYPDLKNDQIRYVCEKIEEYCARKAEG